MRKFIFALLFATSLFGQEHRSMHCPFTNGFQMPKPEPKMPYSKLLVYFIPEYTKAPKCTVELGEAQIIQTTTGWVEFAGKPETRVNIRCLEN